MGPRDEIGRVQQARSTYKHVHVIRDFRKYSADYFCFSPVQSDPSHVAVSLAPRLTPNGDNFMTTDDTRLSVRIPKTSAEWLRKREQETRSEERRVGKEGRSRWSPY